MSHLNNQASGFLYLRTKAMEIEIERLNKKIQKQSFKKNKLELKIKKQKQVIDEQVDYILNQN
tara:strand:- start:9871 stop:10059 length:189 start_codon:yes stop_codon:yes gene_type:complete